MSLRSKKHSAFSYNLMLNLLSVVLIAAVVLALFSQMVSRFRDQEMAQRESLMANEMTHLGAELSNLNLLFSQSKYTDSLSRIAVIRDNLQSSDYYALYTAQCYLASIASANSMIADIVISFSNSGIVLTSRNSYISHQQFLSQYHAENIDPTLFITPPKATGLEFDLLAGGTISPLREPATRVAFIYQMPLRASNVVLPSCYVYLLISYDEMMNGLLTENMRALGSLELLSGKGDLLCAYSAQDEFSRMGTCVSVTDASSGLSANAYLPERYFTLAMRDLRHFVTLGIILVFFLSVFTAWFAAWHQTAPVRQLIADVVPEGIGSEERQNEYAWLKENLRRMNHEQADIRQQLEQYRSLVRSNTLERLFSGATMTPEQLARADNCLSGLRRPFMVGLAKFYFSAPLSAENAKDARTLVMMQKLTSALPADSIFYTFDADAVALLVPCPEGWDAAVHAVESAIARISNVETHFVSITFGAPLSQQQEIAASFDAVLQASGSSEPKNGSIVRRIQEPGLDGDFSFRQFQQFYNLLLNGETDEAGKILRQFLLSSSHPCGSMRQRFYTVRALMMLAASASGLDDAEICGLHYDTSNDGQALLNKFCAILDAFAVHTDQQKLRERDHRTQDILDYISAHFSECDCCPASIAAAFSISEKHLYTLLKENAGTTPAALLLELRLNLAAQLLRESQETIQHISDQCGFSNLNTFYKAFRRIYAVSPSQYRDANGSV